jgi:SagB-type dehydrogenase family enzyme
MNAEPRVEAAWLGQALGSDPEIQLPRKPRFPPEFSILELGPEEIAIVGADGPQILSGAATYALLPRLLRLLDGEHTVVQICSSLAGTDPKDVFNAIVMLFSRGLLEDGIEPPEHPVDPDVDAYLGRFCDVTRQNRNRGQAHRRLASAQVAVACDESLSTLILAELSEQLGPARVTIHRWQSLDAAATAPELLLAFLTGESQAAIWQAMTEARRRGVAVLPIRAGGDRFCVGPLMIEGSVCPGCLERLHAFEGASQTADDGLVLSLVQLAALHAFNITSRISRIPATNVSMEYRPAGIGGGIARSTPPVPGCGECGLPGRSIEPDDPCFDAWTMYVDTSKPPRRFLNPRDYQVHYNIRNIALARKESEACHGAQREALDPAAIPAPRQLPQTRITLFHLTTLLSRAAGYQDRAVEGRRRIAPTGGNLGSVEIGALVLDVDGINPGIYRYSPADHGLEFLDTVDAEDIRGALGVSGRLPACTLIGLSQLGKVFSKYGQFAYRIVHFDAGVALSYLFEVAAHLGLGTQSFSNYNDAFLGRLFGADIRHLQVALTFALAIEPGDRADLFPDRGPDSMRLLQDTLAPGCVPLRHILEPAAGRVLPDSLPLERTIMSRRAVRLYHDRPVESQAVQALIAVGRKARERARTAGLEVASHLELILAVRQGSTDWPAGFYRLGFEGAVTMIRPGLSLQGMRDCMLQDAHALAPLAFFSAANLEAAFSERGPRALRECMLAAGQVVGALWLAAEGLGLGACAAGGSVELGLSAALETNTYRTACLLAIAIGEKRDNDAITGDHLRSIQ